MPLVVADENHSAQPCLHVWSHEPNGALCGSHHFRALINPTWLPAELDSYQRSHICPRCVAKMVELASTGR